MTVGAITLATTRSPNPSSQKIQKKKRTENKEVVRKASENKPSVPGDEYINNLPVLVEEREQIISSCT